MMKHCGAALNPIGLGYIIFEYLNEKDRGNQQNIETARNTAYLYSCLCNEYRIVANYKMVKVANEFYMPAWKWNKYLIGGKVVNRVELLVEMGWITSRIETYSTKPYKRELYSIVVDKLVDLHTQISNFKSEKMLNDESADVDFIKPPPSTMSQTDQMLELIAKYRKV